MNPNTKKNTYSIIYLFLKEITALEGKDTTNNPKIIENIVKQAKEFLAILEGRLNPSHRHAISVLDNQVTELAQQKDEFAQQKDELTQQNKVLKIALAFVSTALALSCAYFAYSTFPMWGPSAAAAGTSTFAAIASVSLAVTIPVITAVVLTGLLIYHRKKIGETIGNYISKPKGKNISVTQAKSNLSANNAPQYTRQMDALAKLPEPSIFSRMGAFFHPPSWFTSPKKQPLEPTAELADPSLLP